MEASEIIYKKMLELTEPIKCAVLSEMTCMKRKVVDLGMKRLKKIGKVHSPKRGYWKIVS